jgi:hypothetical protein
VRALDKMSPRRDVGRGVPRRIFRRAASCCALVAALCVASCMVGPNYCKPVVQFPTDFKEAVDRRRYGEAKAGEGAASRYAAPPHLSRTSQQPMRSIGVL